MTTFLLTLHPTYYTHGYFNVPVAVDGAVGGHGEVMTIIIEPKVAIQGTINRRANSNQTARIMGGVALRDWFQAHFTAHDQVEIP
jgi:hypothetical protein